MRTVGDVVRWWLERVENDDRRSLQYRRSTKSLVRKHVLPRLDRLTLRKLDRVAVDDKLAFPMFQEGLAPRTVQKAIQHLRQAFSMAYEQGRIKENPMEVIAFRNFYRGALKPKPAALNRLDLPVLVRDLAEHFNADPVRGFLPLWMLMHGTRIAETLSTEQRYVSVEDALWVIREVDTKSYRTRNIPLTPQALGLLERYRNALRGRRVSVWLFPARWAVRGADRAVSERTGHTWISEASGGEWTSHDLRKVMRDGLGVIKVDYGVAEMLIGHSLGVVAATYQGTLDGHFRDALERWHGHLDSFGFRAAHGVDSAAVAFLSGGANASSAGLTEEHSISTGRVCKLGESAVGGEV